MGMIRSFIAVRVEGLEDIESLATEMGRIRGMKGVRPENIHLTLKFLGNVDEDSEVPMIISLLREVAERHTPFPMGFKGTGAFPNLNRMRVAWIGIESEELRALAEDILGTLPSDTDEKPQKFRAHLTIGRIKFAEGVRRARPLMERYRDHDFGTLRVGSFEFMKSTLTPQGPIYEVLESFHLGTP